MLAWVATAGSSASTTPPLGTIKHQYIPTTNFPTNGTYCLAANVTSTNPATVPDGTKVLLKPCQWGWRETDHTIRLGNTNKCLDLLIGDYGKYTDCMNMQIGKVDQKWSAAPKPPSLGPTGFEPGTYNMNIFRTASADELCLTDFNGLIVTLGSCQFYNDNHILTSQNLTFVAGSSLVGKGAPGPIKVSQYCFDAIPSSTNASIVNLSLRACNASIPTQQWQVNNDSTVNIANTNKCITQPTGTINVNTPMQVADCIPGNVNQTWSIFRVSTPMV
ncbi:hypothetical protein B0H13DRAFT_1958190 [Mycena leptocephala]|nr:hypothetical protein B0H13DRAFT_1958190 [Mycena leptocephala]